MNQPSFHLPRPLLRPAAAPSTARSPPGGALAGRRTPERLRRPLHLNGTEVSHLVLRGRAGALLPGRWRAPLRSGDE